jgi:hypothetical protein
MTGIRPIIDDAVAAVLAEHPKYFTPKGHEHARTVIVRKVMAAIRGASDKPADTTTAPTSAPQSSLVDPTSHEGRAYASLCLLAGAIAPFRTGDGRFVLPAEANNAAVLTLADLPPKDQWLFLTERKHIGAWSEFFRESLPHAARKPILQTRGTETGILMPWPWPPSKTGVVYTPENESEDTAP